jgi:hypothetical protein
MLTREDVKHWPRTSHGKLVCPDCGQTGWPVFTAGSWVHKHAEHVTCECGKVTTSRTINNHRRVHRV